MRENEDISILLTDQEFRQILPLWEQLSEARKKEILEQYHLTPKGVRLLQVMWSGLDFKKTEQSLASIETALHETIWKLAERKSKKPQKLMRRFYEKFSRVAAILIIPIAIYTMYLQIVPSGDPVRSTGEWLSVKSQPGTITSLILPDGSKVWLNSGSTLSYPGQFSDQERDVQLEGEAYFEVTANKQVPMIVKAGIMEIKVYGTAFNINTFPGKKSIEVTLAEGSVSLSSAGKKLNGKKEFFLQPGQMGSYSVNTGQLTLNQVDPYHYTAWKDGLLIFKNNTFATVLEKLALKFNVDIELQDQSLASIPMDATFRDENVEEILRLLSYSTPFKYEYESPRKLSNGTFAKGKIYITSL